MATKPGLQSHDMYCLNCGQKTIPIFRNSGYQHGRFHRKKLYCPWCKNVVNHIEIRTPEEKMIFDEQFAAGDFKEEALASIDFAKESDIFAKL